MARKRPDGKELEALVSFVERTAIDSGFSVEVNDKVYIDGIQVAELDVLISGKVGTTDLKWLIECRDRPSAGPAPVSWIEQLVGRRDRLNLSHVIAVSTTGFGQEAVRFARERGISLRQVNSITADSFAEWLKIERISSVVRRTILETADMGIESDLSDELRDAALEVIDTAAGNSPIIRSVSTGESTTLANAFLGALQASGDLDKFDAPTTPVRLLAFYPADDDHFVIDTGLGSVRVIEIQFIGRVETERTELPVIRAQQYQHQETSGVISQAVAFEPLTVEGKSISIEMHRLTDGGATYMVLRSV